MQYRLAFLLMIAGLGLVSCQQTVTAKEFMVFVKDEANGHTRTFTSSNGLSWTVTLAPKEYMALSTLRTNKPSSPDFDVAVNEHSDMTYMIVKTTDTQLQIPFSCETFFVSGCEGQESLQALMCQPVSSGVTSEQEFLLGFPAELSACGTSICVYTLPQGSQTKEKIGCFNKAEMKELPSIKLY